MIDKCKSCGNELHVVCSRNVVTDDDRPDVETKLYVVLTMQCVNPQCRAYKQPFDVPIGQPVETKKNIQGD